MKLQITTAALALVMTASVATAADLIAVNTPSGQVVAAADTGLTLYTFRKDSRDTSNCYNSCAQSWPPFLAEAGATAQGGLDLIERRDGTQQWAMGGKPLYFWAGDEARGDVTGDGVGGVWDAVRQ
ncbi:MAG: hypothetical protein AAFX45_01670 [Pseudomonadota bacterium]